jgi:hypothetical protein
MVMRPMRPPQFNRMETAMTKSKTFAAALAALTIAATVSAPASASVWPPAR